MRRFRLAESKKIGIMKDFQLNAIKEFVNVKRKRHSLNIDSKNQLQLDAVDL